MAMDFTYNNGESGGLLYMGDCREQLKKLARDKAEVQMCVTSPPYWALRDYGDPMQIGLEESIAAYLETMVEVFALVGDILADDGTIWINIGDNYNSNPGPSTQNGLLSNRKRSEAGSFRVSGLEPSLKRSRPRRRST